MPEGFRYCRDIKPFIHKLPDTNTGQQPQQYTLAQRVKPFIHKLPDTSTCFSYIVYYFYHIR